MMASAFAPTLLSPVGYRTVELHRLLIDFQVQACLLLAPCPNHYDGRRATMPFADFCLITHKVTLAGAIGFHRIRSPLVMNSKEPRYLYTRTSLVMDRSLAKQTSPDKNMNFPCATASFTVAVRSLGFVVWDPKHFVGPALPTRLQPTPHMMFLFISSQFLLMSLLLVLAASSGPNLAIKPLPFTNS